MKPMKPTDPKQAEDRKTFLLNKGKGLTTTTASIDVIKSAFICEGQTARQISDTYGIDPSVVKRMIIEEGLEVLKNLHIKNGLQKLQNKQVDQAKEILELEQKFKEVRIIQLKEKLDSYMAYYDRNGDFYRRDKEGEIMVDRDGIPIHLNIPNASAELRRVKEAVVLSEGIKRILDQVAAVLRHDTVPEAEFSLESMFGDEGGT